MKRLFMSILSVFVLLVGFSMDCAEARNNIYVGYFDQEFGDIYMDVDSAHVEDHKTNQPGSKIDEFYIITATYYTSANDRPLDMLFTVATKGRMTNVQAYIIDENGNVDTYVDGFDSNDYKDYFTAEMFIAAWHASTGQPNPFDR